MPRSISYIFALLGLAVAPIAHANIIAADPFDYNGALGDFFYSIPSANGGGTVSPPPAGGIGFANAWGQSGATAATRHGGAFNFGAISGYTPFVGQGSSNSIVSLNTGAQNFRALSTPILTNTNSTVYFSYLVNPASWTNFVFRNASSTNSTTGDANTLIFQFDGGTGKFWIDDDAASKTVGTSGNASFGTSYLVVGRMDFSMSGNDTISAAFLRMGVDNASAEPDWTSGAANIARSTAANYSASFDVIGTRMDSGSYFGTVIIGTSYSDVINASVVPEPGTLALLTVAGLALLGWRRRQG